MKVVFATCDQKPLIAPDDEPLVDALAARGVDVVPIPWTEIDPFAVIDSPPVILRSTWDYHRLPTMFELWLRALGESGRATWNPPDVARRNIDKIYLRDLETAGIAIPRTRWADSVDAKALERLLEEERWPRAILKPRIAATAYGTILIEPGARPSDDDLAPIRNSGAMVQELVPEIVERGEISVVYFDGALSHAVLKRAMPGEFRVQQDFGGRVEPSSLTPALSAFADAVMRHVPPPCLYARVDLVESGRGPLLMELELIEPELYFRIVPEAADRMAQIITNQMQS